MENRLLCVFFYFFRKYIPFLTEINKICEVLKNMSQLKKYPRKMTIYLSDKLYYDLEKIADSKGSRVSNVVREILINYLEE
jgi:hypothetical protein